MSFPAIFIFFLVIFLINSAAKKKGTPKQQTPVRRQPEKPASEVSAAAPAPEAAAAAPASMPKPRTAVSIAPTVSVSPHHHDGMFKGSMEYDGFEGDAENFDSMPSSTSEKLFVTTEENESVPSQSGPVLNFSPDNIASAFILQEVLKRPSNTQRGYRTVG